MGGGRYPGFGLKAWLATVAAAVAFAFAAAPAALATHVQCGAVITTDTTLDEDLQCAGNGVLVGADNVTLDLNGHTITGPGPNLGYAGVGAQGAHDGVRVKNGTISDYGAAFAPGNGQRETTGHAITGVTVARTFAAVSLYWMRAVRIENNAFTDSQYAIFVNGPITIEGPQGMDESVILDNSFAGNGLGILPLSAGSDDNLIAGNRFDQASGGGILGDRNLIVRNQLIGVSGGFGAAGDGNVAQGNRIQGDGATGLALDGSDTLVLGNAVTGFSIGISITGAGSRIERNWIVESTTGIAIGDTSGARVKNNRIRSTLGDGISVPASATGALIERNFVRYSETDDGIDVESTSTTLTRNEASSNADLGIEAVTGVTDGGGNRARRNGNPLQCTGVVCR